MDAIFSEVLRMSLSGGILILAVLVLRFVFKRAPRFVLCLLWLMVALRLLIPFQIQSNLSLQPTFSQPQMQQQPVDSLPDMVPAIPDGIELPGDVQISISDDAVTNITEPVIRDTKDYFSVVWLIGICCFVIYGFAAWLSVKRRVHDAVVQEEGVWISGKIDTPFVFGLFRPKIYLPTKMPQEMQMHILAHERSHIRRGDHWWKLIGFAVLGVHWFNPLVWLGYFLFNRDIEVACDERVVKSMDIAERKRYSTALLACSTSHVVIAACPVAFAENSVVVRIKSVLNYKKPPVWIILLCVVSLVAAAVSLMTSPVESDPLEQCRQALEFHQTQNASKIEISAEFIGPDTPEPVEHTYWRYGEDYLVKWYIDDGMHRPGWLLKADGKSYCNGISPYYPEGNTDYQSWTVTDKIPQEEFTDWLDEYRWDPAEITLVTSEETQDGLVVTFTVAGEYLTTDEKTAEFRTVTFFMDKNARLISVKHQTVYYEGNTPIYTGTHTCAVSYDEATIHSMIIGRISEIPAAHIEP